MQRSAIEFSEDLDRLRGADDFKDDALQLLINALQQGTSLFSVDDQHRVVMGGGGKDLENTDG
jgi:ribosome assembly protein 3